MAVDTSYESCRAFVDALASDAPAPGGGGAAALAGALGAALGGMVASLTLGKKKYAAVQEEIIVLKARCTQLQGALLNQISADQEGFMPLICAYGLPKSAPDRPARIEQATAGACIAPLEMMRLCAEAAEVVEALSLKGSRAVLSDAGCASVLLKAAIQCAHMNVLVNTRALSDRALAAEMEARAQDCLSRTLPVADRVHRRVLEALV